MTRTMTNRLKAAVFGSAAAGLLVAGLLAATPAAADGYLATQPEELEDLVLGTDMIGFNVSPKEYNLRTGQSYSLKIKASGFQEYALVAPEFFDFIWLRKVEAGDMEIKANSIYELEFEEESEAEIFFVPIRPGTYQMYARGLLEKGTVVTIHVK